MAIAIESERDISFSSSWLTARTSQAQEAARNAALPALLRAYLALGGWVSDHAVVDRDLGTCHVFTCVELDRLPPARRRAFEGLAAG